MVEEHFWNPWDEPLTRTRILLLAILGLLGFFLFIILLKQFALMVSDFYLKNFAFIEKLLIDIFLLTTFAFVILLLDLGWKCFSYIQTQLLIKRTVDLIVTDLILSQQSQISERDIETLYLNVVPVDWLASTVR